MRKCPICTTEIEVLPGRGRPATYCSDACRRVADTRRPRQRPVRIERYLLFASDDYYPTGGGFDLQQASDNIETLARLGSGNGNHWWHIVDLHTHQIVAGNCAGFRQPQLFSESPGKLSE